MKKKILIVGAGQLGSRHLQGALLSKNELLITVVDPSQESLDIAKERAGLVELGNGDIHVVYKNEMPESESFDVCIMATAAPVRAVATQQLLQSNQVKHIIFEKVLFQKIPEYAAIESLLKQNETTGWVNCPRRLFPTYTALKQGLDISRPVKMLVRGHAWGMACNSIHFIDLFAFLTGCSSIKLEAALLDPKLLQSKRAGFFETTGKLSFIAGEHALTIESGTDAIPELIITLENGFTQHTINEIDGVWSQMDGKQEKKSEHVAMFQSQLTGDCVDELLLSNECGLTPFSQSCELHVPFISALLIHMSAIFDKKLDACPIT